MKLPCDSTVYTMFRTTAKWRADALAIECGQQQWTYGQLLDVVDRLASVLLSEGAEPGDRVAILSENRAEYTMLQLACARIGAIVPCLNWRLVAAELDHCIGLVEPKLIFVSPRFKPLHDQVAYSGARCLGIEDCLMRAENTEPDQTPPYLGGEQGLLLLNTSGTTGLPKAALISHRAEIARMTTLRMDLKVESGDAYLAWSPMYHMGGTDHSLSSLMMGSPVIITDGLDLDAMCSAIGRYQLGWLLLMPATIDSLILRLKETNTKVRGLRAVGAMADLVPLAQIAELTTVMNAPFVNSFGATETGLPPATSHLIAVGEEPTDLAKRLSSLCEIRLVDKDDNDVLPGEIGEIAVRGPTLFSGYWGAPDVNAKDFRNGWFHMGDLGVQTLSGGLHFVGRSKYMIKSGGENIYPMEIERVLLADNRISEAAVVGKYDSHWGETVVAFVAKNDAGLSEQDIEMLCRANLAGYKRPREVHFIAMEDFPRSDSGKIIREALERRLVAG